MKDNLAFNLPVSSAGLDRRRTERYDTALPIAIRFLPDGTPIRGSGIEVGPNGMRITTSIPVAEATYLHVSFEDASNNTFCEGRVVWTRPAGDMFECGVDIQRWGGEIPGLSSVSNFPNTRPKKDRRRGRR